MNSKGLQALKIICIISVIFFIFTLGFYFQNRLSISNIESLNLENVKLKEEIFKLDKSIDNYEKDNLALQHTLDEEITSFYDSYGFGFTDDIQNLYSNEAQLYKLENENILRELKHLIINYKPYYDGSFFESESYINVKVNINKLLAEDIKDELSHNFYNYLDIASLTRDVGNTGTISYLKNINKNLDEKTFNILTMSLVYNFEYLNELSSTDNPIKGNLDFLYNEIYKLVQSYYLCESYGLNLGILDIDGLIIFRDRANLLIESYNNNLLIINSLEEGEDV